MITITQDGTLTYAGGVSSTTFSVTANAGDLIVVAVRGGLSGGSGDLATFSGGGLSFTGGQVYSGNVWWGLYHAVAPTALSATTVTVTVSGAASVGGTFVAVSGASGVGAYNFADAFGVSSVSATITTTAANSYVFGVLGATDSVASGNTVIDANDAHFIYLARNNGITPTSGSSVSITGTSASADYGDYGAYEILATTTPTTNPGAFFGFM